MYVWYTFANLSAQFTFSLLLSYVTPIFIRVYIHPSATHPMFHTVPTLSCTRVGSDWLNPERPFIFSWTCWLEKSKKKFLLRFGKETPSPLWGDYQRNNLSLSWIWMRQHVMPRNHETSSPGPNDGQPTDKAERNHGEISELLNQATSIAHMTSGHFR